MSRAKVSILENLHRLLSAVDENVHRLPDVQKERKALVDALARADGAWSRRKFHQSEAQRATQELNTALAIAKEAASGLRTAAVLMLGRRSEELSRFQVKPLR